MAEAVGIMSGAFFVSRGELLSWLNDFLKLSYTKVEQVADGAAHCQVFDALFPGKVPLHKVNFSARHEYEYVQNYKVLQAVLDKVGIEKHIEVERLIKARAQDNLEFLQWVKAVFDRFYAGQPYNAVERREAAVRKYNEQKPGVSRETVGAAMKRRPVSGPKTAAGLHAPAARTLRCTGAVNGNIRAQREEAYRAASATTHPRGGTPAQESTTCSSPAQPRTASPGTKTEPPAVNAADGLAREQESKLIQKITEMQLAIDNLERERTYYFEKLRDIEMLCQTHPEPELPLIKAIQAVLYDEPLQIERDEPAPVSRGTGAHSTSDSLLPPASASDVEDTPASFDSIFSKTVITSCSEQQMGATLASLL